MRKIAYLVALATASVVLGAAPPVKPDPGLQALQGVWVWDPAHRQTDAVPLITIEKIVFQGNKMTWHAKVEGEKWGDTINYRLDSSTTPQQLDMEHANGKLKGQYSLGIYRIEHGKLKILYKNAGFARPAHFTDRGKGGHDTTSYLYLKRPDAE